MPHCYSQRMLNPYHGIVTVEIDVADAACSGGRDSLEQVAAEYDRTKQERSQENPCLSAE